MKGIEMLKKIKNLDPTTKVAINTIAVLVTANVVSALIIRAIKTN